jgi:diguanylate cyclase (GGDEF)-like protein
MAQKLNVTISMGATLARADDTLESLLKRADELLYQSKSDGRNRVTVV